MYASTRFDTTRAYNTRHAEMSNDALKRIAPSIFAEEPWERMTSKYLFIPTIHVIERMRENGFVPVRATQSRTRIEGKEAFTKHMVSFRDLSRPAAAVGETIPEIVLVNSHDGTSSYQLHAGLYRLVCANGLIVADTTLDSIKCRHSKNVIDDIIEGTNTLIREVPRVTEKIELFKSIPVNQEVQLALAESVLKLRYDDSDHVPIQASQLLTVRRREDKQQTLWHTYNAIEENVIKGGVPGKSANRKRMSTRAIKGVSENVKLEKAIWHLTERLATILT